MTFNPGDPVRTRHENHTVTGTVWSDGPDNDTYWVIPDHPVPNMTQGCIKASLHTMEAMNDDDPFW